MTTSTTTYSQLLDRCISDGITEVCKAYADPKEQHKRDGAIDGFEACRGKAPSELVVLLREAERQGRRQGRQLLGLFGYLTREDRAPDDEHAKLYWRQRYKALQIEWVCNVVSVGLTNNGQQPLFAHLPTLSGALKYAEIVGVREAPQEVPDGEQHCGQCGWSGLDFHACPGYPGENQF
jgi:hypothetical protein